MTHPSFGLAGSSWWHRAPITKPAMYEVSILHTDGSEEAVVYEDMDAALTHGFQLHKSGSVQDVEVVILRTGAAIRFDPPDEDRADLKAHIRPDGQIISYE
jgi:hypothetical protein